MEEEWVGTEKETEVASDGRDAFLLLWPRSEDCGDVGNQVPFLTRE